MDLHELAARTVPIVGAGGIIVGLLYMSSGDISIGLIVAMAGVFILWGYYAS